MKKIVVSLLLLSVLLVPVLVMAQTSRPREIGSLTQLIDAIKNPLWAVFGLIALICFVIAGIQFLTAGGDPDKVKTARTAFLWGIVGIVVGILAYSIVTIIETAL